jgi:hypothetical protein
MLDDLDRLRETPDLQRLLVHYAEAGGEDRDVWQDRLMGLGGVEARELTRLHGLLLAFGWVEQNTGQTAGVRPGAVPGCYRVTAAGLRALRASHSEPTDGEVGDPAAGGGTEATPGDGSEGPCPKRRQRRKTQTARAEVAATSNPQLPAEAAGESVVVLAG